MDAWNSDMNLEQVTVEPGNSSDPPWTTDSILPIANPLTLVEGKFTLCQIPVYYEVNFQSQFNLFSFVLRPGDPPQSRACLSGPVAQSCSRAEQEGRSPED